MSRQQIPEPNFRDTIQIFKLDLLANFNCHRIGIIQSFNSENQTATVKIVDLRVFYTYESDQPFYKEYSIFIECPVHINANATAGFTRPILAGDECLLLYNDRDIDNWYSSGAVGAPRTDRMHHFSDALALVGYFSLLKSLPNLSNNSTRMYYGDTLIELNDKVKIENAAENLKTIVDDLIDIITNLQVTGNLPITAATATALSTLKTRVGTFLT